MLEGGGEKRGADVMGHHAHSTYRTGVKSLDKSYM